MGHPKVPKKNKLHMRGSISGKWDQERGSSFLCSLETGGRGGCWNLPKSLNRVGIPLLNYGQEKATQSMLPSKLKRNLSLEVLEGREVGKKDKGGMVSLNSQTKGWPKAPRPLQGDLVQ